MYSQRTFGGQAEAVNPSDNIPKSGDSYEPPLFYVIPDLIGNLIKKETVTERSLLLCH